MANGIKALRKIQLGRNASSDSDDVIPATTIWRGTGTIEDTRNLYFVQEDVGYMTGSDRTNTSMLGGKIALDPIEATPEQLPHLLEMNIKEATPASDSGGGDGWIYTYPFPTTAIQTLKPYTVEGGDNAGAEVLNFVHGNGFTLSGAGGDAWMMSGELFGKQVVPQAFTGGVTLPAVNTLNFSKTKLYIDADSNDWGTTQISHTLLGSTFKYTANNIGKMSADGALTFSYVQPTMPDITCSMTFEHNDNAIAQKVLWRAETPRLIRLICETGAVFANTGLYSYRTLIIDMAGKWLKVGPIGEQNGNDVVEGTFQVKVNEVKASAGQIVVVNALSALP
jgi:hypothetical protein